MTDTLNHPSPLVELNGRTFMANAKGHLVPIATVRDSDMLEDQVVRTVLAHAQSLSDQIARFKGHTFDDLGAHMALLSEKYGLTGIPGKGNKTFTSYDGLMKIQVAMADTLTFGPELQIAKGIIDECIADWSADISGPILALINQAFDVDKEGKINREALFSLRRIEIDDERWRRAQQAITDSIRIEGTKTYLRFYRRADPREAWKMVTIDLASAELPASAPPQMPMPAAE